MAWYRVIVLNLLASTLILSELSGQVPLTFSDVRHFGHADGLGRIVSGALGRDGSVVVIDLDNRTVLKYNSEGALRWRRGGPGRGPGEFQTPYRITVRDDGSVLVYDLATSEITTLSASGAYVRRDRVLLKFRQVDGILALPDGGVLMAGVAVERAAQGHALHVLDRDLLLRRSFGPLPTVRDPEVLQYWGAGSVSLTTAGDILYSVRIPYRILRYSPDGDLKGEIRPGIALRGEPDDAVVIQRQGRSFSVGDGVSVERPLRAYELHGELIMSGRIIPGGISHIDYFDGAGRLLESTPAPEGWVPPIGIDLERCVMWSTTEVHLEPVLQRTRYDCSRAEMSNVSVAADEHAVLM